MSVSVNDNHWEDYLKKQEYQERRSEYMRKNMEFILNLYIKLLLIFIPAITIFYLLAGKVTNPFLSINRNVDETEIKNLNDKINNLNQEYDTLQKELKKSATDSASRNILIRIADIETKQDMLSQTILVDADKALTARLLREKQQNLEARFDQIQSNQTELNNKIDNIVTTVIVIPIGGVVLSLVSGIIIYLFSKLKPFKNEK